MKNLHDVKIINFPLKDARDSFLVVYESGNEVPFNIKRSFVVKASEPSHRGHHAHIECAQLLVVLSGKCRVVCDDGKNRTEYILSKSLEGLLIPPSIWAEQTYETGTILMVMTDMSYDEADYIRDYDTFLNYRKSV